MTAIRAIAVLAAAAFALAACSTTAERRQMEERELAIYGKHAGEPVDKIRSFRIIGWQPVSDDTILLEARVNDWYLIEVGGPCQNLPFARVIGVESTLSMVQARFDSIIVDGIPCRIQTIRPVDAKAAQREIRAMRSSEG